MRSQKKSLVMTRLFKSGVCSTRRRWQAWTGGSGGRVQPQSWVHL